MGGAARLLGELDAYLAATALPAVTVIGRGRSLSGRWLVRREWQPPRVRSVALNNVCFVGAGRHRTVLLRNALHFPDPSDDARGGRTVAAQAEVVKLACRRAHRIVVPTNAMRARVVQHVPAVADRVRVRPHPVTVGPRAERSGRPSVLVPVLFAPYKRMRDRLRVLADALEVEPDRQVRVTATEEELGPDLLARGVLALGRLTPAELTAELATADMLYYPTSIESFGYPLAEARALGVPVIARSTSQTREVAGPALAGYSQEDPDGVRAALQQAAHRRVDADPTPFDRTAYFDWLLS